jgi:hypothetical protein
MLDTVSINSEKGATFLRKIWATCPGPSNDTYVFLAWLF